MSAFIPTQQEMGTLRRLVVDVDGVAHVSYFNGTEGGMTLCGLFYRHLASDLGDFISVAMYLEGRVVEARPPTGLMCLTGDPE